MKKGTGNKARLEHILLAIQEIENYTANIDLDAFLKDSKTHFATIKQLEIIGEASNHIDKELLDQFTEINWRAIRAFRNILIHEYFNVRLEEIWQTTFDDLPSLKKTVEQMLLNLK